MPEWVKPLGWGIVGGAVGAIAIGFIWGGWVTGGTALEMEAASAEAAVVRTFTPLCVARAMEQPEQLALLEEESRWQRDDFVIDAGWVDNVSERYRSAVAEECASIVIEAMEPEDDAG